MENTELIFIVAVCPVLFQGSGPVCILLHTIKRSLATISSTKYTDIFLPLCAKTFLVATMQTSPNFYIIFTLLFTFSSTCFPAFTICENNKYI